MLIPSIILSCVQDWSDLVEYVIQKCLKARETKAEHASSTKNADDTAPKLMPLEISPAPPEEPFVESVSSLVVVVS